MEVIEHVDPPRLPALERAVFGARRARRTVVVTTPNVEYNVRFETLPAGAAAAPDHRFEWTRAEFARLGRPGRRRARLHGPRSCRSAPTTREVGPPTQLARVHLATEADTA